ncbi:MAG TPA: hypothetical protein VMH23_14275 [Bacteroidota bacterium]|nr:hypothetical protein [Bacteroidota bacterium]
MKRKQPIILLLILTLGSFRTPAISQGTSGVMPTDTTITMMADISGCKTADSVLYRVTADRFGIPLTWSLTVKDCEGRLLLYQTGCACDADKYFESEAYVLQHTYQGTRQDWFFFDLPARVLSKKKIPKDAAIFDKNNPESVYAAVGNSLHEQFGIPTAKADEMTAAVALQLMNGELTILSVPHNPSEEGDPMVFLKQIRQFVPIGHW